MLKGLGECSDALPNSVESLVYTGGSNDDYLIAHRHSFVFFFFTFATPALVDAFQTRLKQVPLILQEHISNSADENVLVQVSTPGFLTR